MRKTQGTSEISGVVGNGLNALAGEWQKSIDRKAKERELEL